MTDPVAETGVDRMARLLDGAHDALMRADYAPLAVLTAGIEAELALLEDRRDGAALLRLRARAQRNEVCLQAVQRGFRSARRRVEEIRAARSGLITYDDKGRRCAPQAGAEMVKRF
jgi:hypothetical protein